MVVFDQAIFKVTALMWVTGLLHAATIALLIVLY